MTKKIDPMKGPPPAFTDPVERELSRLYHEIGKLIIANPTRAKAIVYGMLGNSIACADTIGIDVDAFLAELREKYVKHPPVVATDAGWRPES